MGDSHVLDFKLNRLIPIKYIDVFLLACVRFSKHCQITFNGIRGCCRPNSSLACMPSRAYIAITNKNILDPMLCERLYGQSSRLPTTNRAHKSCECVPNDRVAGVGRMCLPLTRITCAAEKTVCTATMHAVGWFSGESLAYKHTKCNQAYFGAGKKQPAD